MTETKRSGQTVSTPGSTLDVGDYVRHAGTWYRLTELLDSSRFTRSFRGVAKDGGRRALLLDSTTVVAYRWDR
jgi:hypothetical protein